MKRRLISVMLAAILILAVFAACGGTEKNSSKAPESSSSAPSSSEAQSSTTESSLESSDDGEPSGNEPMNLVVAYPLINGVPQDNKLIEAEINEITQEKLNDTIELMPISMGNYQQQMQLMLASAEKLDCFVIRSNSFNAYYSANQMTDLSDLIHEYGQGIIDAVGQSFIDAGKLDGKLYGITTNRDLAVGHGGLVVRQDYMEEAGYKKGDIKTIDDLDGLFAKVHENHPDVQVITSNSGSSIYGTLGMSFDPLTDGFAVLRNFGLDDLTVVNAFATDEYKDYCLHARKWYEAGYISADIAAVTEGGPSQVKAGRAFAYNNRYKPGADNQESKMCGTPVVTLTVLGDATYTSIPQSFMWGIPYSAESPERSMEYLNEQYTNPEIMNLLAWGIEGTHYDITEDGHITAAAALNGAESGYNPSAGWIFGNQFITHVWEGDELDLYKNLKAFNDGADKSKAFGFTFNSDSVLTEIAAVQGVYDQYKIGLESGLVDTETTLDQMLSEMESAGIQKIIDEKQRQLDEWAAANGVS